MNGVQTALVLTGAALLELSDKGLAEVREKDEEETLVQAEEALSSEIKEVNQLAENTPNAQTA